jgi:enterobacterial common antigen flippase
MLYLSFVLGAMGTDYYPRLTAVAANPQAVNKTVNEQAEVAILLSAPVLVAMLTFSPQVIPLLYSGGFVDAISILRWQVMGDFFKLASWPMGFILVAQGRGRTYLLTETIGNLVYVVSVWIGLGRWGLDAAGIGYLICYTFYFFLMWGVAYSANGFKWTHSTLQVLSLIGFCTGLVFCFSLFNFEYSLLVCVILTVLVVVYSFTQIYSLFGSFPSQSNRQ